MTHALLHVLTQLLLLPIPIPQREVERASSLSKAVVPYIIDLETVNGTFVNGERIEASR
jgi:pSer/pThr/pTyr-binding forkhead associated (FHA) protein